MKLIGQVSPGASVSFEAFYDGDFSRVVAVLVAIGTDVATAEELAQEAFARAFVRWGDGAIERPSTWVRTVAVNLARSRFRRLAAERRARHRLEGDSQVLPAPALPEYEAVWRHVRRLSDRQRVAVVLRYVDGLSTSETAEVMGCAAATVRVHLHRARATLATALQGEEVRSADDQPR